MELSLGFVVLFLFLFSSKVVVSCRGTTMMGSSDTFE